MDRRTFVSRSLPGAGLGAAALAGCAGEEAGAPAVHARPRVSWRLVSSFPRALDTIYGACDVLAARVSALTEGRFTLRPYPAGEIVPGLQVLDAVEQQSVEMGQSASYYFVGKNPALAFDCCVPFGLSSRQQTAWLLEGGGLERLREVFADFGVVNLPGGNTGVQMGGWFKREIHTLADLRGLKMRIPGLGGEVMSRLGATVQVIAGGEIYQALERGAIDAAEWVGPYDDEKLGFHKVARYYYYPGWWEPGPALSFYVGRRAWDSLPSAYRDVLMSAALEAGTTMQARYDARNPAALVRLRESGIELRRYGDDILSAAARSAAEVLEDRASSDASYAKLYGEWKAFRSASYAWFATAEMAYGGYAFGKT